VQRSSDIDTSAELGDGPPRRRKAAGCRPGEVAPRAPAGGAAAARRAEEGGRGYQRASPTSAKTEALRM